MNFFSYCFLFLLLSFEVEFTQYEYFTNDDRTRTFVGLCMSRAASERVRELIQRVDKSMLAFDFTAYYKVKIKTRLHGVQQYIPLCVLI